MSVPHVCILTMSYDPRNRIRAVINAASQSYPAACKSLYLMYQKVNGKFPEHFQHRDINMLIKEIDVPHITGKNWWMLKMMAFVREARKAYPNYDPICAIMDEDDGFENAYLQRAIDSMMFNKKKAAWNYSNILVNADGFYIRKHREPVGTTIGYLSVFEDVTAKTAKLYPTLTNGPNDPLDAKWRGVMQNHYEPCGHKGLRYFIQWSGSSTRRNKDKEIDQL